MIVRLLRQLRSITDLVKAGATVVDTRWDRKGESDHYHFAITLKTTPEIRRLVSDIWDAERLKHNDAQ